MIFLINSQRQKSQPLKFWRIKKATARQASKFCSLITDYPHKAGYFLSYATNKTTANNKRSERLGK
ncbi:MAG: hypothetical protein A2445_01390 [Candidatus Jacksonbacteria bacterium RIFOXYC2_FULL_44_29]|nr:MAG: hypothetical protein A2445_01390 [Candidatus Jacksonbacteria bacterium RIFOXYC2_FULL_44_29]OGY81180.1 MAG: hypothetical protein A2550_01785 [Candidatus Jacksonbacteria bacterium RIFOXYD2_FULL_43_21]HCE49024.1 hypothetical protein [Candidatus Jacksonbacteria bacterium]